MPLSGIDPVEPSRLDLWITRTPEECSGFDEWDDEGYDAEDPDECDEDFEDEEE